MMQPQQELIKRSGYSYEEHEVVANDGYITQLVRLVSPLVKRADLKKPPVMIHHGGNIDMSLYLASSSIQHHPEKYPRSVEDGPITSSNRSLAFMLANNGYDVWLIGTRGSNLANQKFVKRPDDGQRTMADWNYKEEGLSQGQFKDQVKRLDENYYQYGLDDIAATELKRQVDKVREVTGSKEFSMYTYSLSTPTSATFLSRNPEYAKDCRVYVQMGPAIFPKHVTFFSKAYFDLICPELPTRGIGFFPFYRANKLLEKAIVKISKSVKLRYSIVRKFLNLFFGPSKKYNTNMELNILARIWQPVSFKSIKQYCQNSKSKKFQQFDYGNERNIQVYGSVEPAKVNISNIQVQNYAIVYGERDTLATPEAVQRIKKEVNKPIELIEAPGYNHLDLIAGVENDIYVNLPVLRLLNRYSN